MTDANMKNSCIFGRFGRLWIHFSAVYIVTIFICYQLYNVSQFYVVTIHYVYSLSEFSYLQLLVPISRIASLPYIGLVILKGTMAKKMNLELFAF